MGRRADHSQTARGSVSLPLPASPEDVGRSDAGTAERAHPRPVVFRLAVAAHGDEEIGELVPSAKKRLTLLQTKTPEWKLAQVAEPLAGG